jgi:hypothetical protein
MSVLALQHKGIYSLSQIHPQIIEMIVLGQAGIPERGWKQFCFVNNQDFMKFLDKRLKRKKTKL